MSTASICGPFAPASTHLAPKSDRAASFRLKKLYIASEGATPAQCTEGGRNTNEWNAHFHPIEAWLLDRGITSSAERFTKFALKIRDLCLEDIAKGGDGWVHIGELRGALRKKRPFSASWVDKAKRPLQALDIIQVRPGYVLYLGSPPRKRRFSTVSVKFSGRKPAQNRNSKAFQPQIRGAFALLSNAGGEQPKLARNAQGRFTRSEPKAIQTMQSEGLPDWRPRGRNIPIPPCPLTPEEIDEVEADIRRREDCLKKRRIQDTQPPLDPGSALPPTPVELLTGGHSVTPAHSEPVQAEVADPPLTSSDPGVISVDAEAMGSVAGAVGAEFLAMFAAFKSRRAVRESEPQPPSRPPQRHLAQNVSRDVSHKTTASSTGSWERVTRGGPITKNWLADVFGSTPRYQDLNFASIRRLNLDINSVLAARALVDGRKGITENHSGMLIAAAKRLQSGAWRMLSDGRHGSGGAAQQRRT